MLPVAMKLMEQLGLEEVARQRHGQLDLPTYLPCRMPLCKWQPV